MLAGLLRDRRVSTADKFVLAGALAYLAIPTDFLGDYLPFIGLVDDLFLLGIAVRRLLRNAGFRRCLRYWPGDAASLRALQIERVIEAAWLALPRKVRLRLRGRV